MGSYCLMLKRRQRPTSLLASLSEVLLYVLPIPLIIKLFIVIMWFDAAKILYTSAALLYFYAAAHLTKITFIGFANTPAQNRHNLPDYRLWSAIYVTLGVFVLMLIIERPWDIALYMSAFAFIGYSLTYGLPYPKREEAEQHSVHMSSREAIKRAHRDLEELKVLRKSLQPSDSELLGDSLDKVIAQSRLIIELLLETPEDANRARRFLNVYVNRIKEILQQYVKLSKHDQTQCLQQRLVSTLVDVERVFREQKAKLLDDDIFRLDIQLEVLNEQIKKES